MNLLVLSAQNIADTDRVIGDWRCAQTLGHRVAFRLEDLEGRPDAVISMSISQMKRTWEVCASALCRNAPLYCYNWDAYAWVWDNPRPGEYDYKEYGRLLRCAKEIWVPSDCTGRRTKQWWGLDNWEVVLSSAPCWNYLEVGDDGYALCSLREIPDPCWGWFERACKEFKIPFRTTKHECSYAEYQQAVARCRFLCSPLHELSTGGLTLLEGYRLGKPVLLSDSPWHGGADYFGERAFYFCHDDYEDFKRMLWRMRNDTPINPPDCREWVDENYSDRRMVIDMLNRIEATL